MKDKAIIEQVEQLRISFKELEAKEEIEALLYNLFDKSVTFRTSATSTEDDKVTRGTIAKKAVGEEWEKVCFQNTNLPGLVIILNCFRQRKRQPRASLLQRHHLPNS